MSQDKMHDTILDKENISIQKSQRQKLRRGRMWYVIHTYSGYEDAVRRSLLQRIESLNMQDLIFDVMVPTVTETEVKKTKNGIEKKEVKRRIFPGYVLVEMIVQDESWYAVRQTPHVTGFVGIGNTPTPISPEELLKFQGKETPNDQPKEHHIIPFETGAVVEMNEGPFAGNTGVVQTIDTETGLISVLVSMFGRETPLEIEWQKVTKK